jgi:Uma2 family endonuclease
MKEPVVLQLIGPEYLSWEARQERKFELHRGFVLAFAGGTIDHDTIAFNVRSAFDRLFPECRTFGSGVKIRVAEDTYYYPDVSLVCEPVAGEATFLETATVIVEVLSRGTRAYDVVEKRASYRGMPGLKAYAIVHTDVRRVELDMRAPGGTWSTETIDDGDVHVHGKVLSLDTIYARSSLES